MKKTVKEGVLGPEKLPILLLGTLEYLDHGWSFVANKKSIASSNALFECFLVQKWFQHIVNKVLYPNSATLAISQNTKGQFSQTAIDGEKNCTHIFHIVFKSSSPQM